MSLWVFGSLVEILMHMGTSALGIVFQTIASKIVDITRCTRNFIVTDVFTMYVA